MAVALVALLVASTGWAIAATSQSPVIRACANKKTGALRLASKCRRSERRVSWNVQGPAGLRGPAGRPGTNGANGARGANGTNGLNGGTKITVKTATGPAVKETETSGAAVNCNAGEQATGGGVDVSDSNFEMVVESFPANGNGWIARVKNIAKGSPSSTVSAIAYVICASP
jgi:hypothetical protein